MMTVVGFRGETWVFKKEQHDKLDTIHNESISRNVQIHRFN